jgi:hypothetical protein
MEFAMAISEMLFIRDAISALEERGYGARMQAERLEKIIPEIDALGAGFETRLHRYIDEDKDCQNWNEIDGVLRWSKATSGEELIADIFWQLERHGELPSLRVVK